MIEHFADRLLEAAARKGAPVCVGLDPVIERLPAALQPMDVTSAQACADAVAAFCRGVIEAVAPHVPAVKLQAACFERYLWPGVKVLHQLIHEARQAGLITILDAKRGDIGVSSEHYAAACLRDVAFSDLGTLHGPDALTVNAYLGADGLQPFIDAAAAGGKGLFALVRTSNPGGDALQSLALAEGRNVAEAVGRIVAEAGDAPGLVGVRGYSLLGAVVGATKAADAATLRQQMPQQLFLVPGFGAQGGGADDVRACFKPDGTGAIITASRSVLYPPPAKQNSSGESDWKAAIAAAAADLNQQIRAILNRRA